LSDEPLRAASKKYASYGPMYERAVTTVISGGVKEHRFGPSGRVILTVVGSGGDEFIDPAKPYCSCSDFFFRVLNGHSKLCYHILSHLIASDLGKMDTVHLGDEEYGQFYTLVVRDVFNVLDRSGGQSLHLP